MYHYVNCYADEEDDMGEYEINIEPISDLEDNCDDSSTDDVDVEQTKFTGNYL